MRIERLDHLVLTVRDVDASVDFYARVLGMEPVTFGSGRKALRFGDQKINLHQYGNEIDPKAASPIPGSADLCLLVDEPLEAVVQHLQSNGVQPFLGPVVRSGALGPIQSVYLRDPDRNLIELSRYENGPAGQEPAARGGI